MRRYIEGFGRVTLSRVLPLNPDPINATASADADADADTGSPAGLRLWVKPRRADGLDDEPAREGIVQHFCFAAPSDDIGGAAAAALPFRATLVPLQRTASPQHVACARCVAVRLCACAWA